MKPATRLLAPILAAFGLAWGGNVLAASHREAPQIALDPAADNTDVYAFISYDEANLPPKSNASDPFRKVTFILNVNPGQDPADGPNYFNFDDDVLYTINIDNQQNGKADDVVYEFRFKTENRPFSGISFPLPYVGNPDIPLGPLQGITALDGPGSEGLTRRQTYTVTEVRGKKRTKLFAGTQLIAVPSNAGPATMPDYGSLAAQGIYTDATAGIRVFAGQRAETFYIDLGAVFDTLNLRRPMPFLIGPGEDNDNVNPFGNNRFSGANISTIAIEVPVSRITSDGKAADSTKFPVIGMYASTARQKQRHFDSDGDPNNNGPFVQVSRMGNPLVNELIITTPSKDKWNASEPEKEAQFQGFYQNPVIALALNLVYGVPIEPIDGSPYTNRTDLMSILLKYPGQALDGPKCGNPCSELLRLDLRTDPTDPTSTHWSRLGAALSPDKAGWPNGRRPNDDVTDIAIRVVGGNQYIAAHVGDGVNFLDGAPNDATVPVTTGPVTKGIATAFPFLPTPYDGRNRRHIDCNEPGGNPCN